ncbi:YlcI/YnfO family protein [Orbus wheelerorum]|uniref:YlcI/YnfO family protein n=1 Tax=Orbus wheelerorum TaxID=3074111 RepID=UPI00370DA699
MQDKKEKKFFERSNSTTKHIRFEDDLLEQIEQLAKKENNNFSAWVKNACREKLAKSAK